MSLSASLCVFVAESNPRSVTTDLTEKVVGALFQLDPRADAEAFALVYNYLFFVVPFYAGLHITYMDKNLFLRAVGDKAPHLLPPGNCNQRVRVLGLTHLPFVRSACRAKSMEDLHEEGADCFGRFAWFPPLRGVLSSHLAGAYLFIRTFTSGTATAQPLSGCIWSRLSMAFCSGTRWPTGAYWRPSALRRSSFERRTRYTSTTTCSVLCTSPQNKVTCSPYSHSLTTTTRLDSASSASSIQPHLVVYDGCRRRRLCRGYHRPSSPRDVLSFVRPCHSPSAPALPRHCAVEHGLLVGSQTQLMTGKTPSTARAHKRACRPSNPCTSNERVRSRSAAPVQGGRPPEISALRSGPMRQILQIPCKAPPYSADKDRKLETRKPEEDEFFVVVVFVEQNQEKAGALRPASK